MNYFSPAPLGHVPWVFYAYVWQLGEVVMEVVHKIGVGKTVAREDKYRKGERRRMEKKTEK